MIKKVNSLYNPALKQTVKLRKNRERQKQQKIIIEGLREIKMAQLSGVNIEILFYCPLGKKNNLMAKDFWPRTKLIIEVPEKLFKKISYRQNPDGFLAVAQMPKRKEINDLKLSPNALLVILEKIEKPGNLGAILRTAAAVAPVEAVIVADQRTDFYNPNVIRASQGTVFKQTLVSASSSEIFQWLEKQKIPLYAATAHGNVWYTDVDWRSASAVALGEESQGLTKIWRQKAKAQIKIPCPKLVSSLNVSVAAGIIIYEAWRQQNFNLLLTKK